MYYEHNTVETGNAHVRLAELLSDTEALYKGVT
jgi:hypothetical protein